ncbi:MAG: FAD-binding oxidoreductase, partial [Acidimicrobiales bacterium]
MGAPMNRRQFLRGAGVLTASVGSALAAGGCSRSSGPPPTTAVSTTSTSAEAADWAALAGQLSGPVVVPGDPAYPVAKLLFNEQFDDLSPAAIAFCATPADVQRCIEYARAHGAPVAARSGGHSYGGYSLSSGLVIDTTKMAAITLEGPSTATIGAGARLIDVYSTLGNAGTLLPGGSFPTVGIAGLTLGGGIGVFDRLFGLTCDNLRSVQLVTADGRLLTTSPDQDPDLFWA